MPLHFKWFPLIILVAVMGSAQGEAKNSGAGCNHGSRTRKTRRDIGIGAARLHIGVVGRFAFPGIFARRPERHLDPPIIVAILTCHHPGACEVAVVSIGTATGVAGSIGLSRGLSLRLLAAAAGSGFRFAPSTAICRLVGTIRYIFNLGTTLRFIIGFGYRLVGVVR
jgi:hypothetical protein